MIGGAHIADRTMSHAADTAFGDIMATEVVAAELLAPLLRELRREPCAHSWQPLLAR
jgi:hypothetical protein